MRRFLFVHPLVTLALGLGGCQIMVRPVQDSDGDGHPPVWLGGDDCNDVNADIFPGAPETIDGVDNDCDGLMDCADPDTTGAPACAATDTGATVDTSVMDTAETAVDTALPGDTSMIVDTAPSIDSSAVDTSMLETGVIDTATLDTGATDVDADGDGFDLDEDCNDTDPSVHELADWYVDADGDGFTDPDLVVIRCGGGGLALYVAAPSPEPDCDDGDAQIYPSATEVCDGLDNDCDGDEDEGFDIVVSCVDEDDDGYGDCSLVAIECFVPPGFVLPTIPDCDDSDATVNPGAEEEIGNGIDDDCAGGDELAVDTGMVDTGAPTACAAGTSNFSGEFVLAGATNIVVAVERWDAAGFNVKPMAIVADGVDGWNLEIDAVAGKATFWNEACVPDSDVWYASASFSGVPGSYSCVGDDIPDGDYTPHGAWTFWEDGAVASHEYVNNRTTPTFVPAVSAPTDGCEVEIK